MKRLWVKASSALIAKMEPGRTLLMTSSLRVSISGFNPIHLPMCPSLLPKLRTVRAPGNSTETWHASLPTRSSYSRETLFPMFYIFNSICQVVMLSLLWTWYTPHCMRVPSGNHFSLTSAQVRVLWWVQCSLSRVRLFVTPWTVTHQSPLFMGF